MEVERQPSGLSLHILRNACRLWYGQAIFFQSINMKPNGAFHFGFDFVLISSVAIQPGKSGMKAENPVAVFSITMA